MKTFSVQVEKGIFCLGSNISTPGGGGRSPILLQPRVQHVSRKLDSKVLGQSNIESLVHLLHDTSVFFSADSLKKELLDSKKITRREAPSSFFSLFFREKSAAKRRSVFLERLVIFLELFAPNELFF